MASTMALSKAEQNALCVSYDVLGTHVELDLQFVKRYLVRGNPDKITDQEIVFFMNTCKMQKLNPLVAGEVYCIKFGNDPAQMVVGKGAYLRRAYEHPDYLCIPIRTAKSGGLRKSLRTTSTSATASAITMGRGPHTKIRRLMPTNMEQEMTGTKSTKETENVRSDRR